MGNGIEPYFNSVYDATYQKVYRYVLVKCTDLSAAEDLVQDIYAEFYRTLTRKGTGYVANPEAFVMQLAKTRLKHHYAEAKRQRQTVSIEEQAEKGMPITAPDQMDILECYITMDTAREIWRRLRQKPLDVQKVFALYYYADMPIREIAKSLKMSESNVKHKLYRTLNELRQLYARGRF